MIGTERGKQRKLDDNKKEAIKSFVHVVGICNESMRRTHEVEHPCTCRGDGYSQILRHFPKMLYLRRGENSSDAAEMDEMDYHFVMSGLEWNKKKDLFILFLKNGSGQTNWFYLLQQSCGIG
ncbi:hypothetical protein POVCU1_016530 [Plasmodium ovale curtisi]|uniref:Uncharacterized protein n=1 Tax=Plasmodium ovale curtisi TaxID=864141 RepID=A0A1A8WCE1_PLAOA|nr:hypothetical protein POVCU1_016530 [Plasmodium ovale curtisi]